MKVIHPHRSEKIGHQVCRDTIIAELSSVLPASAVLTDDEQIRPFECDALAAYGCMAWVVVLPETIQQVQFIMQLSHKSGVPVVARGAGTGLAGGALPLDNGILLCMTKFNKILTVDIANRRVCVQPGVRNLAISERVKPCGLFYAPDPSSQIACSIGGNIAENSGGVHCLKYGLTTHNILNVKLVTSTGDIEIIGGYGLDGYGYDLLALITGSEGLLGIIVEAWVKLLPLPGTSQVMMAGFASVEQAAESVSEIIASGIIPAGLEMMDHTAINAVEDFIHVGYPKDAAAIVLCELDGVHEQVDSEMIRATTVFKKNSATVLKLAANQSEREKMWAGRKVAFPAVGRISADYYCMDGTIPRRYLAPVLKQIELLAEQFGLVVANVFHAGDGNLHPLILYDASKGELEKAEKLGGEILKLSIDVGGTITGEHGVGVEKINYMCSQFSISEIELFHALKHSFDSKGLLNPGKAIPTLPRCAEFGAMHVHAGKIPFPELSRF